MKNILFLIVATLLYIVLALIAFLVGIWKGHFRDLKELSRNYKAKMARFIWKYYKINIY